MSEQTNTPTEEKVIKTLEEDDEFEDFPEDDKWTGEPNSHINPSNLWEEDWDDDDNQDEFSKRLRDELRASQKTN
ncbi:hypothetical protein PICST_34019 [Scheffersomyces stipitis CBS 6054]|uniref:26S proteasome complex subunit SEM1 n=1 Tax=Scheffersomyces stipitis (strain ATCC 58785 / CBS 6054 / NBRC 10063 / NRRL Y-11545) TaxID=322104 RepID=A3GEY4_PICST|nr:predicted protein [Scheffersomyces stipitis CBS 6054]EAZ63250.1 hypothetical protein PICST_34019 [Scheffersomyces stipitis CBS 6054]KAG2731497.1 hypothetical protein G9P44_005084 [Scheffersomyces stipitis]